MDQSYLAAYLGALGCSHVQRHSGLSARGQYPNQLAGWDMYVAPPAATLRTEAVHLSVFTIRKTKLSILLVTIRRFTVRCGTRYMPASEHCLKAIIAYEPIRSRSLWYYYDTATHIVNEPSMNDALCQHRQFRTTSLENYFLSNYN
eukprot:6183660-Pleurochrysis_carterae.AAC.2